MNRMVKRDRKVVMDQVFNRQINQAATPMLA
jgi:hypothetical protein